MVYVGVSYVLFALRLVASQSAALRRDLYLLALLGLFLFSAFRYEVGCDWTGYLNQYDLAGRIGLAGALVDPEPVWWAVLVLQRALDIPYPWINVLAAAVFLGGVHALARRQPDPLGALVFMVPILVIGLSMTALRQGAAIGLVCLAFNSFVDRRRLRFVLWVLAAASLHSSAMIFLLLTPLAGASYSWRNIALCALLAVPGALVLAQAEGAQVGISRYVDTDEEALGAIFRVLAVGLSGLLVPLVLGQRWRSASPADYPLVRIGSWMMLATILLLPVSSVIGDRISYYLLPIQAVIFARIPSLRLRSGSLLAFLPYAALAVQFATWTATSSHFEACYLPYRSWLLGTPEAGGMP